MRKLHIACMLLLTILSAGCSNTEIEKIKEAILNVDVNILAPLLASEVRYSMGPVGETLSNKDNYDGFSERRGFLYTELVSGKKTKTVFPDAMSFQEAFRKADVSIHEEDKENVQIIAIPKEGIRGYWVHLDCTKAHCVIVEFSVGLK